MLPHRHQEEVRSGGKVQQDLQGEVHVKFSKMRKKMKQTAYFKDAIPHILYEYNFIDDHRSIKEFITRYKPKGKHFFTSEKEEDSKAPRHMLMRGKEGQFINWKRANKENSQYSERQDWCIEERRCEACAVFQRIVFFYREKRKEG